MQGCKSATYQSADVDKGKGKILMEYASGYTVHHRAVPLPSDRNPPGMGQDGYGGKITTPYTVKFEGDWRFYQVYACCFSNNASYYIVRKGETLGLHAWELEEGRDKLR